MPHVSLESHQYQSNFGAGTSHRLPGRIMPTIWTYMRAAAILAGSSAALLAGGIAHADPVPAPQLPDIPQQLISLAGHAPPILPKLPTPPGGTPPPAPPPPPSIPGLPPPTPPPAPPPPSFPAIPGRPPPATPAAPAAPAAAS